MKTDESSEDCAAYNKANSEAIALGILEALEPNDEILADERKRAAAKAAGFKEQKDIKSLLQQLDPNTDGIRCFGVRVSLDKVYFGGSRWNCGIHSGWRMNIGEGYGTEANKGWVGVGVGTTLGMNAAQLAKAKAKLAEVKQRQDWKKESEDAKKQSELRYKQYHGTKAGRAMLAHITGEDDAYGYSVKVAVAENGDLTYNGETFTPDQWSQICDLQDEQVKAMQALKAAFTP